LIRRAGGTSGRCCGRGGRGGGRGGWGRGWRRDFLDAGAEHEAGGGDRQWSVSHAVLSLGGDVARARVVAHQLLQNYARWWWGAGGWSPELPP